MKKRLGTVIMIIGLLLMAAALSYVIYNMVIANQAGRAAASVKGQLSVLIQENQNEEEDTQYPEMPTEEIDGHTYIGMLEIPKLNLSLPVMENWDYDNLKIAPCRYSGSYFMDDLVICAHNYARHFSPIKRIDMEEDVFFVTVDGTRIHYIVDNRETVMPTQIQRMIDRSQGEWDLTLFTCNTGGQTRCAVRCVRVDD